MLNLRLRDKIDVLTDCIENDVPKTSVAVGCALERVSCGLNKNVVVVECVCPVLEFVLSQLLQSLDLVLVAVLIELSMYKKTGGVGSRWAMDADIARRNYGEDRQDNRYSYRWDCL